MPDIPRLDWEGSPESFTHEFLKNISILSREPLEAPADRFTSVPNRLNLGRLEVFTPVPRVREDGYQSDCESDVSQIRNPTPLLISKVSPLSLSPSQCYFVPQVPTILHTGFANSYLTQHVSTAARLSEAAGSQPATVEASQVSSTFCLAGYLYYCLGSLANLKGNRSSEPEERCVHKFCVRTEI